MFEYSRYALPVLRCRLIMMIAVTFQETSYSSPVNSVEQFNKVIKLFRMIFIWFSDTLAKYKVAIFSQSKVSFFNLNRKLDIYGKHLKYSISNELNVKFSLWLVLVRNLPHPTALYLMRGQTSFWTTFWF